MPRVDRAGALGGVQLFSTLSKRELSHVAGVSDIVTVETGDTIVREGDEGRDFYLILDGAAIVRHNGRKVATLRAGDHFGELALLDGGRRSATVEAAVPTRLLVIGGRQFEAVLEEVAPLGHKLLVAMAARLRDADSKAFH